MASLLSFASGAVNTLKNDVINPIAKTVIQPVEHAVSSIPVIGRPLINADKSIVNTGANLTVKPLENGPLGQFIQHGVPGLKQSVARINSNITPRTVGGKFQMSPIISAATMNSPGSLEDIGAEADKLPKEVSNAPETPKVGVKQQALNLGEKTNKFVNTVKNSNEVSAPVKENVAGKYVPGTNAEKLASSAKTVAGGLDKATEKVNQSLAKPLGSIKPQEVSDAIATAKAHDAVGNTETATQIYNKLSQHLTASGQTIQAASLLASRSPEGLRNSALDAIKKGGGNITDDLKNQVQDAYSKIKSTQEGTNERSFAVQDLQKIVDNNVKHSTADQAFMLWRTGLLTGPLTATKVALSHAVLNTAEKIKDVPAVALDKVMRPFTGVRSTALTGKGVVGGAAEGIKAGARLLTTGHDTPGTSALTGSYEDLATPKTTYGSSPLGKAANFYTQKVGQVHASIPKGFYRSAYENDLYKQADAAYTNAGRPGDRATFVKNFVTKPSDAADQAAHLQAAKATFQQPTFLGKGAAQLQKVPGGRVLAPFARIATSILTDVKDYSPVGAMQSIYKAAIDSKTGWTPAIQKELVEGIGRGVTGTGVVALGAALAKKGDITTGYPTDKKEQALWAAEGKQENSIKVDGKWRQTPSLGPFASLLQAGAYLQDSKGKNPNGKANATAALTGALTNFTSQSYLSGLTGAAAAVQNPQENLGSEVKLEAGSLVPVGVGQIAAAGDKYERTTQNAEQAIESKIPGLRENLPVAQTVFGKPITNADKGITGLLDPTKPTNAVTNDPVVNELQRLVNTTGTTAVPVPSAPTKISGVALDGLNKSVPLSKVQQAHFTTIAGPQIHNAMAQTMGQPGYKALDDNGKAKALTEAKTNAENAVKTQVFQQLQTNPKATLQHATAPLTTSNDASSAIQKAQIAADKAQFITSGKTFLQKDGNTFQKTESGGVSVMKNVDYQYKTATDQISASKDAGDYTGYMSAAQTKLKNIAQQLQDPNTSPENAKTLANAAATLQKSVAEYTQYAGFTKPTGAATFKTIGTITGAKTSYVDAITQTAPKYNVDINAALAVAAVEGLGGGVGDNGTSFGPFQLHEGGELPAGATQAWAESPAGIQYALQKIGQVAGGLTGQAAIEAIVNNFEKPANPSAEIANALSIYNGGSATLSAGSGGSSGNTAITDATTSSSSSSSTVPKVQNYKTSGGANIKAPKAKAITPKGPKGAYKAPKVSKAKIPSSVSKASVKSSKIPKAPSVGIAKAVKQPKKSPFGEA